MRLFLMASLVVAGAWAWDSAERNAYLTGFSLVSCALHFFALVCATGIVFIGYSIVSALIQHIKG